MRTQKNATQAISLSNIPARQLLQLVEEFTQQQPPSPTKGRKAVYSEAFILTLTLLKEVRGVSFRQLRSDIIHDLLDGSHLPSIGTLAYRMGRVSQERRLALLEWLGQQGFALE